ncbi:MAG: hypothetical protein JWO98_3113 [Frankiales bacterium]|nr:hypothetical protein [Frankiales bacterium]
MNFLRAIAVRLGRFLADVRNAQRKGGLREVLPVVAGLVARQAYRVESFVRQYGFDREYGLDTRGWRVAGREAIARSQHGDNTDFEPMPVRELRQIFDALPMDPADVTFVDLGCGKGGTLAVAALHGFRRVVGVELDSGLAGIALANAAVMNTRTGTAIEVVEADASTYRVPLEPTLVYLYNPFGARTTRDVAESIAVSLREHPRPLLVLYVNPLHREVWDDVPGLRPVGSGRPSRDGHIIRPDRRWVLYSSQASGGRGE